MKTIFTFLRTAMLSTMLVVLSFGMAGAQWTNDTDVNTVASEVDAVDMQSIGTASGKTYIVFWKNAPAPVNMELWVQLLDENGNRLFGNEGKLVSDQIPMNTYTSMWSVNVDDDEMLYIGVNGTLSGNAAYVFKLNLEGNHQYGENGINIGNGYTVEIAPLPDGGMYASWMDYESYKAVLQKYTNQGVPVWDEPVQVLHLTQDTSPADLFVLSDGSVMVVFHTLSYGVSSTLYANRFGTDGAALWANTVQLSNKTTAFNRNNSHAQIGDVVYYGYFGSTGNRFDSFLQRINPDGTLPWGINGVDFDVRQDSYEMETSIAHQEGSEYVWSVSRYTSSNQNEIGLYVQKFHKDTGARQFTDNAKEVFSVGSSISHLAQLQLTPEDLPLFLVRSASLGGGLVQEASIVKLTEDGDHAFENEMVPMATFDAEKTLINLTGMVNNQVVAVFKENKGTGGKIYAQNYVDGFVEPSCDDPSNIAIAEITQNSAKVTWTPGGTETYWEVVYGEVGVDPNNTNGTLVQNTPQLVLNNLIPNTVYEVYVIAICGEDNVSTWVGPVSFTTEEEVCDAPTNIVISNVTHNSAKVTWTPGGTETFWEVVYGEVGVDPNNTGGTLVQNTPELILENLTPNTLYEVYVVAICGEDFVSIWVGPVSFTTDDNTGINDNLIGSIAIYPNPFVSEFTIMAAEQIDHIKIYNLIGQTVLELQPNSPTIKLNTAQLPNGIYMMSITISGMQKTVKMVKSR